MNKVIGLITTNYTNGHFGPLAQNRPAATIPFGGRYRLVDFPLSNMVHSGVRSVGITTSHCYRSIIDHLGDGKYWSLDRSPDWLSSRRHPSPRSSGPSVSARKKMKNCPFEAGTTLVWPSAPYPFVRPHSPLDF